MTTSRDEFVLMLTCELRTLEAEGAGRIELERHAAKRVCQTYGVAEANVAAWMDGDTMRITYRHLTPLKEVMVRFTIERKPMFTINEDEWADVPAGTTRAVPSERGETVRQQVWTGTTWRWLASPFMTYDTQINDVTAPVPSTESPQVAPSA